MLPYSVFCQKFPKYLVISNKCSTFAPKIVLCERFLFAYVIFITYFNSVVYALVLLFETSQISALNKPKVETVDTIQLPVCEHIACWCR